MLPRLTVRLTHQSHYSSRHVTRRSLKKRSESACRALTRSEPSNAVRGRFPRAGGCLSEHLAHRSNSEPRRCTFAHHLCTPRAPFWCVWDNVRSTALHDLTCGWAREIASAKVSVFGRQSLRTRRSTNWAIPPWSANEDEHGSPIFHQGNAGLHSSDRRAMNRAVCGNRS